jgi:hypothetical protein
VSDRFSLAPCLCLGPRHLSPLTGASSGLSAPNFPSPRPRFLAEVTPTHLESSLRHSLVPGPVLAARVPPVILSSLLTGPGRICPVSGDLAAANRNNAGHHADNPWAPHLNRPISIQRSRSLDTASRKRALPLGPTRLLPAPHGAGPDWSACLPSLVADLPGPPISARPCARARSSSNLISIVDL